MPDFTEQILDRFELSTLPTPPHLLLQGLSLDVSNHQRSKLLLIDLIASDVGLYAKLLGQLQATETVSRYDPCDPSALVEALGLEEVMATFSSAATQQYFTGTSELRLAFIKQFWGQSFLCACLAREIARAIGYKNENEAYFCGLFSNLGALVMASVDPRSYLQMLKNADNLRALIKAEKEKFGANHAQVGGALLRRWQLDNFIVDAVSHHHETLDKVVDASALVKIIWLANSLAREIAVPNDLILQSGQRMLGVSGKPLSEIFQASRQALQKRADAMQLKFGAEGYVPLTLRQSVEISNIDAAKLVALREEVRNAALFDSVKGKLGGLGGEDLPGSLQRSLNLLFGIRDFALFSFEETSGTLSGNFCSTNNNRISEFQIPVAQSKSLLAKAFKARRSESSFANSKDLAVIDKQMLSLLNKPGFFCEPLSSDEKTLGLLVLGVNPGEELRLKKKAKIRGLLAKELAEQLRVDESNSKKLQTSSLQEQKIREIIHEVNNPLSIIKNYLKMLSMKQKEENSVVEEIEVIKEEIDRVGKILAKLKNEQKDDSDDLQEVDVNEIIQSLIKVLRASLFESQAINTDLRLDTAIPRIVSNEVSLKQIFTNLLKNAAEALSEKGLISIETHANINVNGEQYIEVKIKDNGPGMNAEVQEKLFLPGNTTKGSGHSGSGLAIVKKLINEIGGQISCQSDQRGTTFSILLPKK